MAMGCGFREIHGVVTVHCAVARKMEKAYRELHLLEMTPTSENAPQGIDFYSSALGEARGDPRGGGGVDRAAGGGTV